MRNVIRVLMGSMIGILFAAAVPAQDDRIISAAGDRYVISAKAGGVNFVEGTVSVLRKNGKSGQLLKGDSLNIGDKVATGSDGKAELLLNPGSYVRLGGDTAFEFTTTALDDLHLNLTGGSAIFEVFASDEFKVTIKTPKSRVALVYSGIYRIDVMNDGGSRLTVNRGKAELADNTIVKSGRQAALNGGQASISKFDSDNKDQLDNWSKARAKDLSRISRQVQTAGMRTSLMQSFLGRGWNMYNSFGLWAFDAANRSYCFLPFGYGWNSPYGYGFGPSIGWYNLPPVVYYPPTTTTGPTTPTTATETPIVHTPRGGVGGIRQPPLLVQPPFAVIQSEQGGSGIINGGGRGRDFSGSQTDAGASSPVYTTPSSQPTYVPAPMPAGPTRADAPPKSGKENQ